MKFGKYEAKKREGTYNYIVGISQWVIGFKNGYEASIITGAFAKGNADYARRNWVSDSRRGWGNTGED